VAKCSRWEKLFCICNQYSTFLIGSAATLSPVCGLENEPARILEHTLHVAGTAAEVLDDEVRAVLCPDKLSTAEWLEVSLTPADHRSRL